jgi:hypothetical protein
MISTTRRVDELYSGCRAQIRRGQSLRSALRDGIDRVRFAERRRPVSPKQPRDAIDIQHDAVAAVSGRVDRRCFDVAQRPKNMRFQEVGAVAFAGLMSTVALSSGNVRWAVGI